MEVTKEHIQGVYGIDVVSERMCRRWFEKFQKGDLTLKDDEDTEQLSEFDREALRTLIENNPLTTCTRITNESDSEESNTLSGSQLSKNYHHRPFYSKFTYSSQSTPTRRFPYEPKSTRSSSTASETKITFNEDEYTKITTPRQDVLFKKGYLNKPKNYQTQTSTGNSTASTGNSTGNGTPDHQSADGTEGTDLEYESQFVFPNAFVDQNGIYYINSYEHYPLLMYNPTICYPEYPPSRTKRHSTGSLTESTSPHTEETSQDLSQSGGENAANGPEFNHVYNVMYPGYYFNGVCSPNVTTNGQAATEPRKTKKKRRRKISKTANQEDSTTSEDGYSSDEAITQVENRSQNTKNAISCNGSISTSETTACLRLEENSAPKDHEEKEASNEETVRLQDNTGDNSEPIPQNVLPADNIEINGDKSKDESIVIKDEVLENQISKDESERENEHVELEKEINNPEVKETSQESTETKSNVNQEDGNKNVEIAESASESKFNLNAEEFVPRALRNVEPLPVDSNLQFINIHPNFVPLPLISHGELNTPPFNPQFLPPGIPLNFIPSDPKLLPNFINFVPNHFIPMKSYEQTSKTNETKTAEAVKENDDQEKPATDDIKTETKITESVVKEIVEKKDEKKDEILETEKPNCTAYKNDVDIAKIVSKLEEAAKEQKIYENRRQNFRSPKFNKTQTPRQRFNSPYEKSYQNEYRQTFDKRKPRRYENRTHENGDIHPKGPTGAQREVPQQTENLHIYAKEVQTDLQIKTEVKEVKETPPKPIDDDRKYSPRHQNYKYHNSPRKFVNYNKNNKSRTSEMSYSAPASNYSDSVKKAQYGRSCTRFEKHLAEKPNVLIKSTFAKKVEEPMKEIIKTLSPSSKNSQWISVSNRKKRKNKSATDDETDAFEETSVETTEPVSYIFQTTESREEMLEETHALNTAQNSVTTEKPEEILVISTVDSFIEMVANSKDSSPVKICSSIDIPNNHVLLQDVKDIEEELLKEIMKVETIQIDTSKDIPELKPIESLTNQPKSTKDTTKKKSRKGSQKSSTKRIIILDPDISKNENEKHEKSAPKEDSPKIEEPKPKEVIEEPIKIETENVTTISEHLDDTSVENVSSLKEDIKNNSLLPPFEISGDNTSTPDKKKSKKKKKQPKPALTTNIPSVSSSSTTLNNIDESYDFLLDTTSLVDEKTNIEVSEELDKMIQKGLFGNLEEKFRSLNVSVDDDFFKSLNIKPKTQSTQDKGFIKATNFTTILNNGQTLPKAKISEDQNKIDVDFSKIKLPDYEPQPSTSKTGNFLEETVLEIESGSQVPNETTFNTKSNGKLKNKSKKNLAASLQKKEINQKSESSENHQSDILKNEENALNHNKEIVLVSEKAVLKIEPNLENPSKNGETFECSTNGDDQECQYNNVDENEVSLEVENVIEELSNGDSEYEVVAMKDNDEYKQDGNNGNEEENKPQCNGLAISEQFDRYESCNGHIDEVSSIDNSYQEYSNGEYTNTKLEKIDAYASCNGYVFTDNVSNVEHEIFSKQYPGSVIPDNKYNNVDFLENNLNQPEIEQHIIIQIENGYVNDDLSNEKASVHQNIIIEIGDDPIDNKSSLEASPENEESLEQYATKPSENPKPLYPITQAVRAWMNKTRETTPEIELLKSPDTIYKEFIGNNDEEDSDTDTNQKNVRSNPSPAEYLDRAKIHRNSTDARVANKSDSDDEITVFETWSLSQETSTQEDLLDCWEPDIVDEQKGIPKVSKTRKESIEEGEDVLEVYESKYGKNEDFLRLKAEIDEQKRNGNFPKHGNLPYRAICCSLM